MQLSTYRYSSPDGWDQPLDAALDSPSTLLFCFGPSDPDCIATGLADLRAAFPLSIWTGCSTAGEIHGCSLADHTLAVAVIRFAYTTLRVLSCEIADPGASFQAGAFLSSTLAAPDLAALFVLSDGLAVNGSELAKGLSQHLPQGVRLSGGLAADGSRFEKTWVLVDKAPTSHHVVAVGLYGDHVGIAQASRGGWDILGPVREVTRAVGNVLYTLDGQPALALYKKYLGERAEGLPATGLLFPLAISNAHAEDGVIVRTILAVNEVDNSIIFAGDIPQGSFVHLMHANFERLIDGAGMAASQLVFADYPGGPLLTVAISCVGRRLVLSQRTEEEIEAVRDELPHGSQLIGYYSYGELAPLASGRCELHNQTMTLTSFWEK